MTLILSCATRDFVLQVSDRKTSYPLPDGTVETKDRDANKVVVVCNNAVVGYTGLAELDGEDTDAWVAKVLTEAKARWAVDACQAIAPKATAALASVSYPATLKRQAFVAVGWQVHATGYATSPVISYASNALDSQGKWREAAANEFTTRAHVLTKPRRFLLLDAGCLLSDRRRAAIERILRQAVRGGAGAGAIAYRLASVIRKVADDQDAVGKNLMVVCIPRESVKPPIDGKGSVEWIMQRKHQVGNLSLLSRGPRLSTMSFLTAPEEGTETKELSPYFVCAGAKFRHGPIHASPVAPGKP